MFHVKCFVEDKLLAEVMHALAGRVKGLEVLPVNAVAKPNGAVQPISTNASEAMLAELRKRKLQRFIKADAADAAQAAGYAPGSAPYFLKNLRESGHVKMTGKGSGAAYEILEKKA